jgi:adenosylhomocysteine nucleosidase
MAVRHASFDCFLQTKNGDEILSLICITPLHAEFDAFMSSCANRGYVATQTQLGRLPAQHYLRLGLTLVQGGHGKTQFGIHTQHVLDYLAVQKTNLADTLVICAGAAGALVDGVNVGDVVIATETVEHDYQQKFVRRPLPRFAGHGATLERLRLLPTHDAFRIHFAIVASGDEDVIEVTRGAELNERTGGVAVAWEGVGGARSCKFCAVPFVEMCGVTDTANHSAPTDFETNLTLAMHNIVEVICAYIGVK